MVLVYIDGHEVHVDKGSTILQACAAIGVEIPRFCYHERLSIAGNCRMCLVEVEKSAKPVASCAMPVMEGMKVFTNSTLVKKAREGVLEFLLINHPLDCPICDQGGECDLQDQAMIFGSDRGRFYEFKRGVDDKNLGPLVKTIMTRCIHCTRCIRFAAEVAGVEDLGTTGRGRDTEVGTYIAKTFDSELSGNVIDLCPVGALTSKPYAFTARSWELKSTESIDVLDAIGSNIRIDVRGSEIMRILPRLNEDVNEEWISDKTRFAYDGLKRQRLNRPMIKDGNEFIPTTWVNAFQFINTKLKYASKDQILAVAGTLVDAESLLVMRDLFYSLGTDKVYTTSNHLGRSHDLRINYLTNTTLSGIENSDVCILVGTNPRIEAPLLNTRLRKNVILNRMSVYTIGSSSDLTYSHTHLGNSLNVLHQIAEGKHYVCQILKRARKPSIIIGENVFSNISHSNIMSYISAIAKHTSLQNSDWNGVNILHINAGSVAACDFGIQSYNLSPHSSKYNLAYLIGVDDQKIVQNIRNLADCVVYQGHHGDIGAMFADIILPGSAYTEKESTYVNLEGRSQKTKVAFYPPGDSREDWKILRALAEFVGIELAYSNIDQLYSRMQEINPHHTYIDSIQKADAKVSSKNNMHTSVLKTFDLLTLPIDNFYMTDSISRASQIMAKCSKKDVNNYTRIK